MLFDSENSTVVDTAEESANGKWSAVSTGYYDDNYIIYFTGIRNKLLPHQNLGYYLRHIFIMDALEKFYSIYGSESQVVVLGCGYDTLFLIMNDQNIHFSNWFELDKEELINNKIKIISKNPILQASIHQKGRFQLRGIDFNLITSLIKELHQIDFDDNLPTLFIDEFSMIYFDIDTTLNILKEIGSLKNSCFASYGMTGMNDEYGTFIKEGFEDIGVPLKSYQLTATEDDYIQLFLNSGFEFAQAMNSNSMLKYYLDENEKKRVLRLEYYENPMEMLYFMKHYCAALGGSKEFVSILPSFQNS